MGRVEEGAESDGENNKDNNEDELDSVCEAETSIMMSVCLIKPTKL